MTYSRFLELFPDHDACLAYLKAKFHPDGSDCPSCGKATKFHPIKGRNAFSCQFCGHQVYPTAGTIFHKSSTSLQLWFWAVYLVSSTRCGISAKQLEREIGVSYPTAHRMFKQIRTLLGQDDEQLVGKVEMDETFVGGKPRAGRPMSKAAHDARKTIVFGAVERGGHVRATIIPNRWSSTLGSTARKFVLPESTVFTDELASYLSVGQTFKAHQRIRHLEHVYVDGDVTTNAIEAFFGHIKNGLRGVYHSVSTAYLQSYLDEYCFRFNARVDGVPVFWAILDRVEKQPRLAG